MNIKRLRLVGYIRLATNGINELNYSPQSKCQVILGSNGSGKSSLLEELSPLPANKNNYYKGGIKEIEIEHNGKTYTLISDFTTSQKHSFLVDGEEINTGNTVTVQRDLVKQHFGYTNEIHAVKTGRLLFKDMTSSQRREWFVNLSENDYSFAISTYQKLNSSLRDVKGVIKRQESKLVLESAKLIKPEELNEIKLSIDKLKVFINSLIESKAILTNLSRRDVSRADSKDLLISNSERLINLANNFRSHYAFTDEELLDSNILSNKLEQVRIKSNIDNIAEELEKRLSILNNLSKEKVTDIVQIDARIKELTDLISGFRNGIKISINYSDVVSAKQALETIIDKLQYIFSNLIDNPNKEYNRDYLNTLVFGVNELERVITEITNNLNTANLDNTRLEHLKNHDNIKCPKCEHSWIKDYDANVHKRIQETIKELNNLHYEKTQLLEKKKLHLEEIRNYFTLLNDYQLIVKQWDILSPLWEYIKDSGFIFTSPKEVFNMLATAISDFNILLDIYNLELEQKHLIAIKEDLVLNKRNSIDDLNKEITDLDSRLHVEETKLSMLKISEKELDNNLSIIKKIQEVSAFIRQLLGDVVQDYRYSILEDRISEINTILSSTGLELAEKETMVRRITDQESIVRNIKLQIEEAKEQEKVLTLMVNSLSPTDGLIAKGLTGFMNNFIKQMNAFIRRIWTYPLVIQPFVISSESNSELDYKFRVSVNYNEPVDDINETSSAMQEIINLAFKIVSDKYLSLLTGSVFLDEIGRTMDHTHRTQMFNIISEMFNQSEYSNVFIVSHFESNYGIFTNADINVLCSKNVIIPDGANVNEFMQFS